MHCCNVKISSFQGLGKFSSLVPLFPLFYFLCSIRNSYQTDIEFLNLYSMCFFFLTISNPLTFPLCSQRISQLALTAILYFVSLCYLAQILFFILTITGLISNICFRVKDATFSNLWEYRCTKIFLIAVLTEFFSIIFPISLKLVILFHDIDFSQVFGETWWPNHFYLKISTLPPRHSLYMLKVSLEFLTTKTSI